MVFLATLSRRAVASMDKRSCKARSICCSFSGVVLREFGFGVKVLLQSLQRQRLLPLSLVPKRITGSAW